MPNNLLKEERKEKSVMKCLQCSKEGLIELIIVNYFVDLVSESHKTRSVTLHSDTRVMTNREEKKEREGKKGK